MENIEELKLKVKEMLIDRLGLDITPDEINDAVPIFGVDEEGNGLNMDSVDALELVVGLNEEFGIKTQSDDLTVLYSVDTLVKLIQEHKGE